MGSTKQNILKNVQTFALAWLALGWLLAVAYGQERSQLENRTNTPAAPEILSVQPVDENGEPHLRPGKKVTLIGRNFSPELARNRVGIRMMTDNPQTPPPLCEYAGEIHLTAASPERLEAVVPLSVIDGFYMIWVRVEGAGHSKPVKVWLGAQPAPPSSRPITATVDIARYASGN
jgi:hypothetical protein